MTTRPAILSRRLRLAWAAAALLAAVALAAAAADEPDSPAPGLIARFSGGSNGTEVSRLAPDLAWDWGEGSPDPRLPADGFRLVAEGSVLIQTPGTHRFFHRTDGASVLRVDGRPTADAPVELRSGILPIRLEYRHGRGPARVAVDWEGPGFAREPLPARLLFHDPAAAPPPDRFEQGRRLADRLGCANCHAGLGLPGHPTLGPPLNDDALAADPDRLAARLTEPSADRSRTGMPAFGPGLTDGDAADIASFLARGGGRGVAVSGEVRMALNVADPDKGRLIFRSVGCLGCHGLGGPPGAVRPTAPDLKGVGRGRPALALAAYLEHPRAGKTPSRHRPDLRLSADEAAHLAVYLVPEPPTKPARNFPTGDPDRGRALADRLRCGACHATPRPGVVAPAAPLPTGSGSRAGCLADRAAPVGADVPRFTLTDDERAALRAFVAGRTTEAGALSRETLAADLLRRYNCLGCHARDGAGGLELAARLGPLLGDDQALGSLKGTLTPPDLTAVGDKLRPEFFDLAVRGEAPTARPWLSVRMPAFAFAPGEADLIVGYLRGHDRMRPGPEPPTPPSVTPPRSDPAVRDRAARLIGREGFGCVSCHVVAGRVPPGGEAETMGPDLALAHRRMTEAYFRRWVADPQRILPGTPMPQFSRAIAGVAGSLDDQLHEVWQMLGNASFAGAAGPEIRATLRRDGDRALVVRDMVLVPALPDTPYTPRGLAAGFKNDASVLFDTDRLAWLAAWRGGFLSRTKAGRLWEWHPEGNVLWTAPERLPPVVLVADGGKVVPPVETRERFGTFRLVEFVGDGVRLDYRLDFGKTTLGVTETVRPEGQGWSRTVRVAEAPAGTVPALVEQPPAGPAEPGPSWTAGPDRVTLRGAEGGPERPAYPGRPGALVVRMRAEPGGGYVGRIHWGVGPAR